MQKEIKQIADIANEIDIKISQIKEKMARIPRSERARKIQIATTHLETASLWLESAIKEEPDYLNIKNRHS